MKPGSPLEGIYIPAKEVPERGDIFFTHSRHVEAIILMTKCGSEKKK
jgi:hypothetical protein